MTDWGKNTDTEWQERKLSGERTYQAYLMRTHDARFIEMLSDDQQRAIFNIEVARRVASGSMGVKSPSYTIPGRKGFVESETDRVHFQKIYDFWMHHMGVNSIQARDIILRKVDGESFPDIFNSGFMTEYTAKKLLKFALDEYCVIAGWTRETRRIPLTESQAAVYESIRRLSTPSRAPSYREIMEDLGLKSSGAVHKLVDGIVERGWAVKHVGKARAISLI